ncbi:isoprenylcysteine carboxylmethyltransferase family protein [Ekhidna sp.]|uniref:methyltransferase family protein n=1 Tax=Ekhidna sp. TaxID=2608089 RepID=UPI003514BB7D
MKLKIPPVVIFFISLGMLFGLYYLIPELAYSFLYQRPISRIFLIGGALCALMGIVAFRTKSTTVDPLNPNKASSLVTHGIYQYSRNPMYVGMAMVLLGGVIRIGSPLGILAVLFFVWYLTQFQIKPEEETLRILFKEEYENYCQKVRRWI